MRVVKAIQKKTEGDTHYRRCPQGLEG